MKFQREQGPAIFKEMEPLLHKHWQEIAHYKDIALNPDWETYNRLEDAGSLRVFTARDDDNQLIGYAAYFVRANIHYKQSIQAYQDVLFIDPSKRGVGGQLIAWCDEQLKAEKIQAVYHHVKAEHNFGPLLEKLGYRLIDLIYARRLD